MANKMLIDATHPEETRVVVVRGNRVEEFDFESANRKQLRGNIYLAKVTRVEPSLQAAFVDYGGNRHGFLAFSEIHPDYYQIPVADRQALIAEEERAHRDAEAEADRRAGGGGGRRQRPHHRAAERPSETIASEPVEGEAAEREAETAQRGEAGEEDLAREAYAGADSTDAGAPASETPEDATEESARESASAAADDVGAAVPSFVSTPVEATGRTPSETTEDRIEDVAAEAGLAPSDNDGHPDHNGDAAEAHGEGREDAQDHEDAHPDAHENGHEEAAVNGDGEEEEVVESVGGADAMEEVPDRMPRLRRQYKIQEVIKRRQIMLVQVVKEERGTKGAALTTYLSLAGRYSVLMPNTARGGGISRKITSFQDRKRLKEVAQELEVPDGMGVILRTAGAARTKTEIKRDFEYLLRMWETVRDVTLKSTAPTLVYEEGSLVKRSIRDLYNKDIDEVIVAGDTDYHEARDFMRMLMPSHAKNVKPYRDTQPILTRFGIEAQLDAMFSPVVQLRSGGYIVINQAEALVAIDVNSGRATREHHIEDTALKTNLEAADEIARQLRLRDLAGLIVIDFIDMDEKRNNRSVERRLKEALKHDRARIQVGRISHFGLLEMSRQRIRTSVLESSTDKCPHCGGTGHVRSVASVALQVLRMIEETLLRGGTHNLGVRTRSDIAIYVLNHKRAHLRDLEDRFRITITINADAAIGGQTPFMIERGEQVHSVEQARAIAAAQPAPAPAEIEEEAEPIVEEAEDEAEELVEEAADETAEDEDADEDAAADTEGRDDVQGSAEGDGGKRRRRRRRRARRGEAREGREGGPLTHETAAEHAVVHSEFGDGEETEPGEFAESEATQGAGPGEARERHGDGERRRRRRGRRGGRRNRREREGGFASDLPQGAQAEHEDEEAHGEPGAIEPELGDAVADFGGPPLARDTVAPSAPDVPEMSERAPEHAEAPVELPSPESPRRRSTVREPVALDDGAASYVAPSAPPAEAPSPAAAEDAPAGEPLQDEANKPRRTGWWGMRRAR
jgi:ribonuclease E